MLWFISSAKDFLKGKCLTLNSFSKKKSDIIQSRFSKAYFYHALRSGRVVETLLVCLHIENRLQKCDRPERF